MIPYWQELGINAVELMPAYEFDGDQCCKSEPEGLVASAKGKEDEDQLLGLWQWTSILRRKRSYCATRDPQRRNSRDMIKAFPQVQGISLHDGDVFPGGGRYPLTALRALQFWKQTLPCGRLPCVRRGGTA